MRRRWLILFVTLVIVGCTLIVGLIIHEQFYTAPPKDGSCQSHECIDAAAQILNFIDTEVDPCDNFYKFACGNFLKSVEIPDDANEISTISILNDNLQTELRSCLEEPIQENEIRTFRVLKTYYKACMNTEEVARRGIDVLTHILEQLGGWPVLTDSHTWNVDALEWYIYVYKLRKLGLNTDHIITLDVDHDLRNSTFYKLKIDKPTFTLPREFLVSDDKNEYVEEYRRFMVNVAVYLGADHYRALKELTDAFDFETQLAAATLTEEDYLNTTSTSVTMSIRDLEENYPSIPWYDYISTLVEFQVPITRSEHVIITSTEYLEKLEELLATTSKRDQINYLVWKVIETLTPYLTHNFRKLQFKFETGINGNFVTVPRWKACVLEVYNSLPVALSAKYIRSVINDETMEQVNEIATSIKDEFVKRLKIREWESPEQKYIGLEKIATLTTIIGFPEELFIDDKLNEVHKEIDVNSNEYLLSYLNITRAIQNLKYRNLRRVKNKVDWLRQSAIADVVASYDSLSNIIRIPAGLFQGTYFNKLLPKYINYAGIGFIIGREMGYALFDEHKDSKQCFIEQFNNFTVEPLNETVNGIATLRNNIADSLGLRHSYAAYQAQIKEIQLAEDRLSGLNYSPEQLFWIHFALNQCSNIRLEHLKLWMSKNFAAHPEYRVIGSLQNVPSFSFDFDCDSDSQMAFEDHCAIW